MFDREVQQRKSTRGQYTIPCRGVSYPDRKIVSKRMEHRGSTRAEAVGAATWSYHNKAVQPQALRAAVNRYLQIAIANHHDDNA